MDEMSPELKEYFEKVISESKLWMSFSYLDKLKLVKERAAEFACYFIVQKGFMKKARQYARLHEEALELYRKELWKPDKEAV